MASIKNLWDKYWFAIIIIFTGILAGLIMYSTEDDQSDYNKKYIVGGVIVCIGIIHVLNLKFPSAGLIYVDSAELIRKGSRRLSTALGIKTSNSVAISG